MPRNFHTIVIIPLSIQKKETAKEVLTLQQAAYRKEVELIGFEEIPPLRDSLKSLQNSGETFYGYFLEDELAGAIAYKKNQTILDIHRLMVAPKNFRKGIASALLHFVEQIDLKISEIKVQTAEKNRPAVRLYQKVGFTIVRRETLLENLSILCFSKTINKKGSSGFLVENVQD